MVARVNKNTKQIRNTSNNTKIRNVVTARKSPTSWPSHDKVWEKAYGNNKIAQCPVCRVNLMVKDIHTVQYKQGAWHRSHIKSRENGGSNDINNITPICWKCNRTAHTRNMKEYAISNKYNYDKNFIK